MAVHGQEPGELDGCHPSGRLARRPSPGGRVCTELQPFCSPAKPECSKTRESDALKIPWRA